MKKEKSFKINSNVIKNYLVITKDNINNFNNDAFKSTPEELEDFKDFVPQSYTVQKQKVNLVRRDREEEKYEWLEPYLNDNNNDISEKNLDKIFHKFAKF